MRRAWLCAAILAAMFASAHAEPITLADAIAAVPRAPTSQIAGHDIAAAEALAAAAGAWAAPTARVATNRLTARLVVGASVPLPIFGTVGAARDVATAEAGAVRADAELVRRDLRYRVVVGWIAVARADGEVAALAIGAHEAAELERIARGRLDTGMTGEVDVTVATAARIRADVAVASATRNAEAASAALAGLLGWDPTRRINASGELPTGAPTELAALHDRLAAHPERAAALRKIEVARAEVAQVSAARWPGLFVEGQVSFDDPTLGDPAQKGSSGTDAMIGVALELPIFSHLGDRATAARATEAAQRARLAATEATLGAELVAAYRRWQGARERLVALDHDVVPAQVRASTMSSQAYREGARDLAFALQAERDLTSVQADLNTARADAAVAYADLQVAIGEPPGASGASAR